MDINFKNTINFLMKCLVQIKLLTKKKDEFYTQRFWLPKEIGFFKLLHVTCINRPFSFIIAWKNYEIYFWEWWK